MICYTYVQHNQRNLTTVIALTHQLDLQVMLIVCTK